MKIKIIPNPRKDWAENLAKEVHSLLVSEGHEIVKNGADATICIGGDGTILYANHKTMLEGPILGIGSKTSYICQLQNTSWKDGLLPLLKRNKTIPVMTLCCTLGDQQINALNDFVVHTDDHRVIHLSVVVDNEKTTFSGDGLILSTALGTAGYAYSAGGEILVPTERKISIVPICAYRRTFSPQIVEENKIIEINTNRKCAFIADGIFIKHLEKNETVIIKKDKDIILFQGVGYNQ